MREAPQAEPSPQSCSLLFIYMCVTLSVVLAFCAAHSTAAAHHNSWRGLTRRTEISHHPRWMPMVPAGAFLAAGERLYFLFCSVMSPADEYIQL